MPKPTDRFTPDNMFTGEAEINKQDVFLPTRYAHHRNEYVRVYVLQVEAYGAVAFETLNELENIHEEE